MTDVEKISIREFSRRLGCSDTAVRKAIRSGHIRHGLTDADTKRPKIIPGIAMKEWREHIDPAKVQSKTLWAALWDGEQPNEPDVVPDEKPTKTAVQSAEAKAYSEQVKGATAVKTQYAARMAKLKFEQASGELVNRDQVFRAFFAVGQEFRAAIMSVPDRVIDEVFAADDRNVAHDLLYNALADVLEKLSETKEINLDG